MPQNRAAWQDKAGIKLSIRETPYPSSLSPTQLLLKPEAWAINPADHMLQTTEFPFVKYPVVLGEDVAGTVIAAGTEASSRFKPNDRVLAFTTGATNESSMGGFQEYVIAEAGFTSHIPAWMSFAEGSVFPLGIVTSTAALFGEEYLALSLPSTEVANRNPGSSVLIWGGSSAVGSNAIQLAKAAGLEVLTTASPRSFECVRRLGASKVFDYNALDVAEIVAELDRRPGCVGIFHAAGAESVGTCLQISANASAEIYVVSSNPVPEILPPGVRAKMVFGGNADFVKPIFENFLPSVLAKKQYLVAPEPIIVPTRGLEGVQEGYEMLKEGVSARKVVVLA
jgi:NADPH:quinone reductase-like Zn-dependent oxidoreductase